MSEYVVNDYMWKMNLTVNFVEKRDAGEYVCSSVNALGKADGSVRLQGTRNFDIIVKSISFDFSFFLNIFSFKRLIHLLCIKRNGVIQD